MAGEKIPRVASVWWPGDLDFDPMILHHYVTGRPMPKWAGPIVDSGR